MTRKELYMEQTGTRLVMHPKKFALWLFIVSIIMLFAAFTSAYLVKSADGQLLNMKLPSLFNVSTLVIILSSVSMQWAYVSAKNNEMKTIKGMLIATVLLGSVFLIIQLAGWGQLVDQNIYFAGSNALASFIYVLTGLHGLHLVSGIFFLIITMIAALNFKVHSKNIVLIQMCATYWHFLGGLWIYLFLFLNVNL